MSQVTFKTKALGRCFDQIPPLSVVKRCHSLTVLHFQIKLLFIVQQRRLGISFWLGRLLSQVCNNTVLIVLMKRISSEE